MTTNYMVTINRTHHKTYSHNQYLRVAQYKQSKHIASLNWQCIKVMGKPLSHYIAVCVCVLGNMQVKPRAAPLNAHAKVVYN